MPAVTGSQIVSGAFALLNVFTPGESIPANDGEFARTTLNDMLSEWGQRKLFCPVVARERFDLSGIPPKGGPYNPYTIGSGGDFNTERPPNQDAILAASLIQTGVTPEVRIPLGIFTDDGYFANQVPGQTSTQPTGLYYNPTYAAGLGSVYLWPVVNIATNDLELLLQKFIVPFADLSTTYYLPDGAPRALKLNLADALQGTYGRTLSASDARLAISSLATFKRSNHKLTDLPSDAAGLFGSHGRPYNIIAGNG